MPNGKHLLYPEHLTMEELKNFLQDTFEIKTGYKRVLVVEDNLAAQNLAKTLLSTLNCIVDSASDGMQALTLYNKNHYDLIFMDISLGEGMNGYEVAQHIRGTPGENYYTPIIALTANVADDNKQQCIDAGIDALLIKPLTHTDASDILNTFVTPTTINAEASTIAKLDLPVKEEKLFELDKFPLFDYEEALKNCPLILYLPNYSL